MHVANSSSNTLVSVEIYIYTLLDVYIYISGGVEFAGSVSTSYTYYIVVKCFRWTKICLLIYTHADTYYMQLDVFLHDRF